MELKPIKTEAEHETALREIECLWGAKEGTADGDRLENFATLVKAKKDAQFPWICPIQLRSSSSGWTRMGAEWGCMKRFVIAFNVFTVLFFASSACWCEEPEMVTVCKLKDDPALYNHKLIEVEGFVSSDFEDFTLFDPTCRSFPDVWLQYGGKTDSGTMYCCGTTPNSRHA